MATGINRKEQFGGNAVIASSKTDETHCLPPAHESVEIQYSSKLSKSNILQPIATKFFTVRGSDRSVAETVGDSAFLLTDNLLGLHRLQEHAGKVSLIYMDPPYNTGLNFHSRELKHSYDDRQGEAAYVEYMRRRIILMRELLTADGSIYVHIGTDMLFLMKLLMDEVFGKNNFRNLISRRTCSSKNSTKNNYQSLNDYVLFYTKSSSYKWNQPGSQPDDQWIDKEYTKVDAKGRYKLVPVHAPGTRHGETGKEWKGMLPPPGKHWQLTPEKLDALDAAGEIHWSKNGNPRRKVYLSADKTVPYTDYWPSFRDAHHQSVAITGYPTEKNLDMLEMIIGASTDEGDLVLDPFCGSGTTLHAASNLKRRWIGIDQSFEAAEATLKRLRYGLKPMGDFVDGLAKSNIRDLFECEPSGSKIQTKARPTESIGVELLVEEQVLATHSILIERLASI